MEKINLNFEGCGCCITVGKSIVGELNNVIRRNKCFFVIDKYIYEKFYDIYFKNIFSNIDLESIYLLESIEENKSLSIVMNIIKKLNVNNYLRDSILIGIGGGIVGDIVGFVSSIYMRGIKFINVPTTLLSQIDSSMGGKNALNVVECKNLIGTFNHPERIIIDIKFLNTLSKRELISGLAEAVKYGIILEYDFLVFIEENLERILNLDQEVIEKIILNSCKFKMSIVEKDEFDFSLRKILNYGHTIGHAIESVTNYSIYTHGEAVLIGMFYEACISYEFGFIDKEYFNYISYVLKKFGISIDQSILKSEQFYSALLRDKKNKSNDKNISFILPVSRSKVLEYYFSLDQIKNIDFLKYCF